MSWISGPMHLQPRNLQDDEKELVMGYGVEVVPGRQGLEVVPGQNSTVGLSAMRQRELPPPPREPTILGLRRATFFLSIALVLALLAGAIASGVEGNIAAQCTKANNLLLSSPTNAVPTATVTITATTIAPTGTGTAEAASVSAINNSSATPTSTISGIVIPTVGLLALDCPNLSQQLQSVTIMGYTWYFKSDCGADYSGHDIVGMISYSYHDCLQACAMYNIFWGDNQCTTVHFVANMTWALPVNFANCWLKNGTDTDPARQQGNLVVTALLTNISSGQATA